MNIVEAVKDWPLDEFGFYVAPDGAEPIYGGCRRVKLARGGSAPDEVLGPTILGPVTLGNNIEFSPYVELVEGCVIGDNVTLGSRCQVGRGATVYNGAQLSQEVCIGDYAIVGSFARLEAGITVGPGAVIGANAIILGGAGIEAFSVIEDGAAIATGALVRTLSRVRRGNTALTGLTPFGSDGHKGTFLGEAPTLKVVVSTQEPLVRDKDPFWEQREAARSEQAWIKHCEELWYTPLSDYLRLAGLYGAPHFVRPSLIKEPLWVYTASEEDGLRDRQVRAKFGKILRKLKPDLSDERVKELATLASTGIDQLELKITTDPDEIYQVYKDGPESCMSGNIAVKSYGGSPDVALAYVVRPGTTSPSARCLLNTKAKKYHRIYGEATLMVRVLEREGYQRGDLEGCKLHLAEGPYGGWMLPWLDHPAAGLVVNDLEISSELRVAVLERLKIGRGANWWDGGGRTIVGSTNFDFDWETGVATIRHAGAYHAHCSGGGLLSEGLRNDDKVPKSPYPGKSWVEHLEAEVRGERPAVMRCWPGIQAGAPDDDEDDDYSDDGSSCECCGDLFHIDDLFYVDDEELVCSRCLRNSGDYVEAIVNRYGETAWRRDSSTHTVSFINERGRTEDLNFCDRFDAHIYFEHNDFTYSRFDDCWVHYDVVETLSDDFYPNDPYVAATNNIVDDWQGRRILAADAVVVASSNDDTIYVHLSDEVLVRLTPPSRFAGQDAIAEPAVESSGLDPLLSLTEEELDGCLAVNVDGGACWVLKAEVEESPSQAAVEDKEEEEPEAIAA